MEVEIDELELLSQSLLLQGAHLTKSPAHSRKRRWWSQSLLLQGAHLTPGEIRPG